ncbi:nitrile hydratase accessory protein [Saccharopolyspora sp. K220]|uniref:nitrile hydratase accessory protein n=1 Tax=Saccharopolyspora soli TaxID=2926618 RepID=UPI001F58BA7F|nr:nitrile hydratase accessory protein [Saccharopolyspora soli]MCI2421436.1 nitrile hydratase accessory protein [Saccharopolyspora soli]
MSIDITQVSYDDTGHVSFHESCVTDHNQPVFDAKWQRRAFGLAVALSEFGHYRWQDFQAELIAEIGTWQETPADARSRWEYYQHWTAALTSVIEKHGLLEDGYLNPEDRDGH